MKNFIKKYYSHVCKYILWTRYILNEQPEINEMC